MAAEKLAHCSLSAPWERKGRVRRRDGEGEGGRGRARDGSYAHIQNYKCTEMIMNVKVKFMCTKHNGKIIYTHTLHLPTNYPHVH